MQIRKLLSTAAVICMLVYFTISQLQKGGGNSTQVLIVVLISTGIFIFYAPNIFNSLILEDLRSYLYTTLIFVLTVVFSIYGIKTIVEDPSSLLFSIPATIVLNSAVYLFLIKSAKRIRPSPAYEKLQHSKFKRTLVMLAMLLLQISLFATKKKIIILAIIPSIVFTTLLTDIIKKSKTSFTFK